MSLRALIVEDEALIALDIGWCLEQLGHEVIGSAADAAEAIELARGGVDLALVDLNLRDGPTGPALGQALAQAGAAVLYLTANPRQLPGSIHGPIGVLPKPYTEEALAKAIRFAVGVKRGRPALPPAELSLLPGSLAAVEGAWGQADPQG